MFKTNLAAIDLGTNSCRLKITDKKGKLVYREAITTKLGEGMSKDMCFTPAAFERGVNCLSHYAEMMKKYDVGMYRAITTASCRMAKNGAEFVEKIADVCSIKLEIVSGYEEALLNVRGAILNAPEDKDYVLVYDLGGGSTEITFAKRNSGEILHTVSIPWGARNASECFDLHEYTPQKALPLQREIEKYAQAFVEKSKFLQYLPQCCCIATSSTPLRLMSMIKNTKTYDMDYADGLSAPVEKFDEQIAKIFGSNLAELKKNIHIGENRAPIIVAAGVIFQTIYKTLQIKELMASLKGAQDAIINDLVEGNNANEYTYKVCKRSSRP